MKIKKLINQLFLVLIIFSMIIFPSNPNTAVAAEHLDDNPQVEKLFDQMRESILLEDINHNNFSMMNELSFNSESIDAQLAKYGITKISSKEAMSIANGSLNSVMQANSIDIPKPDDYNGVSWYKSQPATMYINGKHYEVLYLRAVASSLNSPLVKETTNIKYVNRQPFQILQTNIIKYVINQGISESISEISKNLPIVGLGVRIYDAIKSVFSGVKTTDVIEEVTTQTTVRSSTDVKFVYVKPKGVDTYPDLNLVTTKMSTVTTFDSPVLLNDYDRTIDAVIGKVQIAVRARDYNDSMHKAATYYSMGYALQTNYVDLDVMIQDARKISVPTATPLFPLHLM